MVCPLDPVHATGGSTLAHLRRLRGLSQSDLARITGLRQETICRAERGKARSLRPSSVRALAKALTDGDTTAVVLAYSASAAVARLAAGTPEGPSSTQAVETA